MYLSGSCTHRLDEQKRIIFPSKYREALGETLYISKGLGGCLFVYGEDEWGKIIRKMHKNVKTEDDLNKTRVKLEQTLSVIPDKQGRVTLTDELISFADLNTEKDNVKINGYYQRVEIWSAAKYGEKVKKSAESEDKNKVDESQIGLYDIDDDEQGATPLASRENK